MKFFLTAITGVLFVSLIMTFSVYAQKSPTTIAIDPNTDKIYVSRNEGNTLSIIDGKTNKLVANIPMGDQHQTTYNAETVVPWAAIAATAGVIVTAIIGIRSYRQGQVVYKKDIQKDVVFPLIKEFDESTEMYYAKMILEDVPIKSTGSTGGPYGFYTKERLLITLQDHDKPRGQFDIGDGVVRNSFDRLFDFFTKLDYLKSIKLLEDAEINYFRYYIDKAADIPAAVNYARTYFPLLDLLRLVSQQSHPTTIDPSLLQDPSYYPSNTVVQRAPIKTR